MRYAASFLALLLALVLYSPATLLGQSGATEMHPVSGAELVFEDIQPPGFEPGMKIAAMQGDPGEAAPYVLRLSFPDGYRFPPHWHAMDENVTVVSGTFLLAMGAEADEAQLTQYRPGDYLFIPARMQHYGGATGHTVIQLHGIGPFTIETGDPDEG